MTSIYSLKEFENRLQTNVSEEPYLSLSTKDFSGKTFCGSFGEGQFQIRRNSFWTHINAFTISGTYSLNTTGKVQVDFNIKLLRVYKFFQISIFPLILVGVNTVFFAHKEDMSIPMSDILKINGCFILLWVISLGITSIFKRMVENRFKEVFGIRL